MLSYEYIQFLNEKIIDYLPAQKWKHGNRWNFRCPLCGDGVHGKHRGWWYMKNASYYCFNCGTGMSGIKFLQAVSGKDYTEIQREYVKLFLKSGLNPSLSSDYNIPQEHEQSLFDLKPAVKPEWKKPLTEKAVQYLEGRKVLEAPFFDNQLYSCFAKNGKEEYILIPWTLCGVEAYYQLNDFQKLHSMKYIFPKDQKKLVCGLDNIDVSFPYIFVFEGFYDSVFVKNGIAVGTKAITDYQLSIIKDRYPKHQVVISFDNDESGIQSMERLLSRQNDFKYFKWFDKGTKEKDINDYILAKQDVNMFSEPSVLEKMIVDRLMMKMFLVQNGLWKSASHHAFRNGISESRKKREIQPCSNRALFPVAP